MSHVTLHTLHVALYNSHVTRHSSHFTGDYCLNTPELNIHKCVRLLGHNWTRPPSQDDDDFNSCDFDLESQEEKSKVTNPTTQYTTSDFMQWTSLIAMITEQLARTLDQPGGPDPRVLLLVFFQLFYTKSPAFLGRSGLHSNP